MYYTRTPLLQSADYLNEFTGGFIWNITRKRGRCAADLKIKIWLEESGADGGESLEGDYDIGRSAWGVRGSSSWRANLPGRREKEQRTER